MEEQTKELEIDLNRILFMMRKRIALILLITIFGGVLAGCVTEFFIAPTYTASCKMSVYSNTNRISTDSSISESEITASQELVNTYMVIIKSDTVLDKVISKLNLDMSAAALSSKISASQIQDTFVFKVSVETTQPKLSAEIVNAISEVAPDEIVRIIKAGGVEVFDYGKIPTTASGPNLQRNIIIGIVAAFVLSFAFFFIKEMFDTTITNERDIQREFEIPILGTVPRIVLNEKDDKNKTKKGE